MPSGSLCCGADHDKDKSNLDGSIQNEEKIRWIFQKIDISIVFQEEINLKTVKKM